MSAISQLNEQNEAQLKAMLSKFELGQYLSQNKKINDKWLDYVLEFTDQSRQPQPSALEEFIIYDAPITQATQQRRSIFQQILQQQLRDNMHIASIASGLASALFKLDYSQAKNCHVSCFGYAEETPTLAKHKLQKHNKDISFDFKTTGFDKAELKHQFDLIESNGMNIYLRQTAELAELYQQLHTLLKSGGTLVISAMTPENEWESDNSANFAARKTLQKRIYNDTINVNWVNNVSTEESKELLLSAGFNSVKVYPDRYNMFPTFLAQ